MRRLNGISPRESLIGWGDGEMAPPHTKRHNRATKRASEQEKGYRMGWRAVWQGEGGSKGSPPPLTVVRHPVLVGSKKTLHNANTPKQPHKGSPTHHSGTVKKEIIHSYDCTLLAVIPFMAGVVLCSSKCVRARVRVKQKRRARQKQNTITTHTHIYAQAHNQTR